MSKEIKIEINIEGKTLYSFSKLHIHQQFNAHHTFELVIDHDALEATGTHTLQKSQDYIGKFITVCFGQQDAGENIFKGIITEIGLEQSQGLWGNLVLKGYSPTYLMEGGKHFSSFYKRKLKDMLQEACSGLASNDMDILNKPVFTSEIAYMCQYNESNFEFINRLSSEYGEWFFYDGQCLYFGKPSEQEKVEVVYGEHIESMSFAMRLAPSNVNHFSYNSKDDQLITSKLPSSLNGMDSYTQKALDVSDKLYKNPVAQPSAIRTSTKVELDTYAKNHKAKLAASTVLLNGQGDEPKLKLGSIISLKVSQKGLGVGQNEHGEYTIIGLNHYISGVGEYSNSFEAIPAGNSGIPFHTDKPLAEPQIATVLDNSDPDGQGRVRVQMHWQKEKGQQTDWIRVMTPDAGGSDKVSKNRGFVFIPEVGDQVVVGFRYGDANRPFVMGSMFHGKAGGGGGGSNNSKSLTTKSGSKLALEEGAGSVTVVDAKGNELKIDGSGNITITSSESIKFTTGSSSIELKKDGTIDIKGKEITIDGSSKVSVNSQEIAIDGKTKVTMNSSAKVEVGSPSTLVEGKAQLKLTSTGIIDMEGTAMTNVKGGLLNLNCG